MIAKVHAPKEAPAPECDEAGCTGIA